MNISGSDQSRTPSGIIGHKFQGGDPLGVLTTSHNLSHNILWSPINSWVGFIGSFTGWCLVNLGTLQAQVSPDGTLGTQVNTAENIAEITGGTRVDSNLFHSFQDFSVKTGNTAFFNHASDISNIVGRVTGGNIPNIDGLIRANGNANLILLNPSGINFGANASLDIGGSFLGSTADNLIFDDGTVFSARDIHTEPRLTISVPIGLQFGQNSAAINVSGKGHNLTVVDPLFSPIAFGEKSGLRVKSGKTLALAGGEITIDGGTIAAPGGNIELGSVAEGIVNLDFSELGLGLGYENISAFENIQLRSQSLVDASGTESIPRGSIQVQGRELTLNDGSLMLVQNRANQGAGEINVNAAELVTVRGTSDNGLIRSSLTNETLGIGKGGDLKITTSKLTVDQGATIVAKTLQPGTATGGNIDIDALESVQVVGSSSINPSVTSSIVAASFGAGDSGNNSIKTNSLNARAGGTIAATAFNTGDGGDIDMTANSIELIGIEPNVFAPSAITASTLGSGNAGNLAIDTSTLTLLQGGRVDASTAATGNAGSVAISATDSITIDGIAPGSINPSLIVSAANILDPVLREVLRLPDLPSGNSGNVSVSTPQLQIYSGGQLTVRNDGTGDAGNLEVAADSILLDNQGSLSAATQSGIGGNITLSADNVFLRRNSTITATGARSGDGGNIIVDANNIVVLEGSRVIADAFMGMGGNIQLDTQGFFVCEECQITASSQLGIDGQVNIETLQPDPQLEIVDIPQQLAQAQEEVAIACPIEKRTNTSELTITGRGGLPPHPQESLSSESLVEFNDSLSQAKRLRSAQWQSQSLNVNQVQSHLATKNVSTLPLAAQSWYVNSQGIVVLTAQVPGMTLNNPIINSPNCHH